MSLILNIDTSIDTAYISLSKDGEILSLLSNSAQKEHGAFIQPAIQSLLKNTHLSLKKLDAISIAAGPGSYTGLRVGMASAKGLCYALDKPLITIDTLPLLAYSSILENTSQPLPVDLLLCPMIDARRMEVFTGIYTHQLQPIVQEHALILDDRSFANSLLNNQLLFFGNGAKKWEPLCKHPNALFATVLINPLAMSILAFQKFKNNNFANLAYSEPLYLKEFFGGISTVA